MYEKFLKILSDYSNKDKVEILHRGFTKEYAFDKFNLDVKYNSIEQFGERLFFFGEKSKYFQIEKHKLKFELNDISNPIFKQIFDIYMSLEIDLIPSIFYENNKKTFEYFTVDNEQNFLKKINSLSEKCQMNLRNYYFSILHQLENNDFKGESFLVSTSSNLSVANGFTLGKGGIIINFWNWKSKENMCDFKDLPYFNGVPYPYEDEISIFGAIFPHYIYSFTYEGELYVNPNLFDENDFEIVLFTGFDIDQTDFKAKLEKMTSYKSYLINNGEKFEEK